MFDLKDESKKKPNCERPSIYTFKVIRDGTEHMCFPPRECYLSGSRTVKLGCAHCVYYCKQFFDYPTDEDGVRIIPEDAICPHNKGKKCFGNLYVRSAKKITFFEPDYDDCLVGLKQYNLEEITKLIEEEIINDDDDKVLEKKAKSESKKYRWRIPKPFAIEGKTELYAPFAGTGYYYYNDNSMIGFCDEYDHCVHLCKQFKNYRINSQGQTVIPQDAICPYTELPCRGDGLVSDGKIKPHIEGILLETKLKSPAELPVANIPKRCPKERGDRSKDCGMDKILEGVKGVELSRNQRKNLDSILRNVCAKCVAHNQGR